MTVEEAVEQIQQFSEGQKAIFNQVSKAKIYDQSNHILTPKEHEMAQNLAEFLNDGEYSFINSMNAELSDDEKLSGWPC